MTKRKVHSGSNGHNRRQGGHHHHKRQRPSGERQDNREQNREARPPRNEFRGNRSFNQPILPPPSVLQEYEYASDGAAARIIEMAEVEQDRRNKWEIEYMRFYKKSLRIGQLFGFLLLALVVLAVMSLSAQGKDQVAQVLGGSAFFAVAVASIFSGNSSRRNSRRPRYDRSRFPASEPDEKA